MGGDLVKFSNKTARNVTVLSDEVEVVVGGDIVLYHSRFHVQDRVSLIHMLTNCLSVQVLMKFVVPGKPKCYEKR